MKCCKLQCCGALGLKPVNPSQSNFREKALNQVSLIFMMLVITGEAKTTAVYQGCSVRALLIGAFPIGPTDLFVALTRKLLASGLGVAV